MKRPELLAILCQFGAPLLGASLGAWLLVGLLLPRMGLGEVDRIRQLGAHIGELSASARGASPDSRSLTIVLGDSITREGIDTRRMDETWRQLSNLNARFENWAISGCSLAEQRIQLPLALETLPEQVVFSIGPTSLCHFKDLPLDKAYAYAYAGFDQEPWADALPPGIGLSAASLQALNSPRWRQQLHFRTAPKSCLNQRLRSLAKRGQRSISDNWSDPFTMSGVVGRQQLQWHLQQVSQWWSEDRAEHVAAGEALLRQMAALTRESGAVPILVLVPVHPSLREAAEVGWRQTMPAIERVANDLSVVCVDARAQLDLADFADALHPNQQGRERLSRFVAGGLRQPIMAARRPIMTARRQ